MMVKPLGWGRRLTTFNRTRRYTPSIWRAMVAAGRLTWLR